MSERQHPDRGWWVKFDRAQEHLDELNAGLKPLCAPREHAVSSRVESNKRPRERVYRVTFAGEPDERWPLLVGDFLFNLSCALDHLAVALNPANRRNKLIYFPIYVDDPWRRADGTRRYVERSPTNRKIFSDSTRHMLPEAQALIKWTQPYAEALEAGKDADDHVLSLLKRFHTTDKHRRLVVGDIGCVSGVLTYPNKVGVTVTEPFVAPTDRLVKNDAPIKRLNYQVDMKFVGSFRVAFAHREPRVTKLGVGPFLGADHLPAISKGVEDRLRLLETYVQW